MKPIYLSLIILSFSLIVKAQSNSVLDLLNSKNIAVSKTEKRIADIDQKIYFDILNVENMVDGKIVQGLIISVNRNNQIISNVLDSSEIAVFKKALSRLENKLTDNEFMKKEFSLSSGSGVLITSNYSEKSSIWIHKLEVKKSHLDPSFHFGNEGLVNLIRILETTLKEIQQ